MYDFDETMKEFVINLRKEEINSKKFCYLSVIYDLLNKRALVRLKEKMFGRFIEEEEGEKLALKRYEFEAAVETLIKLFNLD